MLLQGPPCARRVNAIVSPAHIGGRLQLLSNLIIISYEADYIGETNKTHFLENTTAQILQRQ
jgi:hypothetical protein